MTDATRNCAGSNGTYIAGTAARLKDWRQSATIPTIVRAG